MKRGIKVLEKGYVIDGEVAVITETIENTVTVNDLQRQVQQYANEQQRLIQQMEAVKKRYEQIEGLKTQVNQIISEFEVAAPVMPEVGETIGE